MLRLFATSLQRNARTILTNTTLPRSALRAITYANSRAWKSDSHHKPSVHPTTEKATEKHTSQQNPAPTEEIRVVIVRGLPQTWTSEDISAYFEESRGVQRVNLIKGKLGNNTGKALLTFSSSEDAEGFISKWDRTTIKFNEATQIIAVQPFSVPKKEEQEVKSDVRTAFISNLAYNCDNDSVYIFASDYGEVVNVDIPTTANNKNKGHAYITFKNAADAQKFVSFAHEKELLGRKIRAQLSQTKVEGKAAKKAAAASSTFNFSKEPMEVEEPKDELRDNLKLYKQFLDKERPTSYKLKTYKFIKHKDVGSPFDL